MSVGSVSTSYNCRLGVGPPNSYKDALIKRLLSVACPAWQEVSTTVSYDQPKNDSNHQYQVSYSTLLKHEQVTGAHGRDVVQ